jgi:type IV pilus assembly protein PilA
VLTSSNGSVTGVAVMAILAAVALPAYQDYTVRSQVSEGIVLSDGIKTAIVEYYATNGRLPRDLAAIGLPQTVGGKYTQSVRVDNGTIVVTFGGAANSSIVGKTLRLVPRVGANSAISWRCGPTGDDSNGDVPQKYLPASCRATH